MHAASLSAVEVATMSAPAAARAAREEVLENAARVAVDMNEVPGKLPAADAEVEAERERTGQDTALGSLLAPELVLKAKETERVAREHQLRWVKLLVRQCPYYETYPELDPVRAIERLEYA